MTITTRSSSSYVTRSNPSDRGRDYHRAITDNFESYDAEFYCRAAVHTIGTGSTPFASNDSLTFFAMNCMYG